jgi:hypothetical protein
VIIRFIVTLLSVRLLGAMTRELQRATRTMRRMSDR